MIDERPTTVLPRVRFSIARVLWATVACSVLLAALRSEMGFYLAIVGAGLLLFSTGAGAMLAMECGRAAFRHGFCMAMLFYLTLLCAALAACLVSG